MTIATIATIATEELFIIPNHATTGPNSVDVTVTIMKYVQAFLVLWATSTGKGLTNHLSKVGLFTISPPGTAGYLDPDRISGSACHQLAVPIFKDPGRAFYIFDMGKVVRFDLATQNPCPADDATY